MRQAGVDRHGMAWWHVLLCIVPRDDMFSHCPSCHRWLLAGVLASQTRPRSQHTPQIHTVRRLFEEGRNDPPLTRNQPPVAGAIRWCRSLLGRVRCTWVRLQALSGKLEELDAGRRAAAAMTGGCCCWRPPS